mmetsp:Transcript_7723/g.14569  ORF Transcript_7723/g.14569 Transcript_7723/m.14569 type:complete len:356 (-) Transcript_7723:81-1148(-)
MSTLTIRKVNELKESLTKELHKKDATESEERCKDILNQLDAVTDMSVKVLSETLIGKVVSKLKSHHDNEISAQAKTLVKKWKQIVNNESAGVGSAAAITTKSSSAAAAATAAARPSPGEATKPAAAVTSVSTTTTSASKPSNVTAASSLSSSHPSSSSSSSSSHPPEWEQLPPLRKNTAKKLHETFQLSSNALLQSDIHIDAIQSLLTSRASEVEVACHEYAKGIKQSYTDKIRSLIFNLKKNTDLRENVILGSTTPETLVQLPPEQLVTAEKSKEISQRLEKLKDSRRLDWEQANESKINEMCGIKGDLLKASLFTCGRCKSIKTTSTQKQTRSADEPMTVFVLCLSCGNRWKC